MEGIRAFLWALVDITYFMSGCHRYYHTGQTNTHAQTFRGPPDSCCYVPPTTSCCQVTNLKPAAGNRVLPHRRTTLCFYLQRLIWSESEALECQTHKSVNGAGCRFHVLHSDRFYVAVVFTQCRYRPVLKLNRCPEFPTHSPISVFPDDDYSNEKYCSVCKCVLYNRIQIVFLSGSVMLHTPGIAHYIMCKWLLSFIAKLRFFCISSQWSSFIFQCISSW